MVTPSKEDCTVNYQVSTSTNFVLLPQKKKKKEKHRPAFTWIKEKEKQNMPTVYLSSFTYKTWYLEYILKMENLIGF